MTMTMMTWKTERKQTHTAVTSDNVERTWHTISNPEGVVEQEKENKEEKEEDMVRETGGRIDKCEDSSLLTVCTGEKEKTALFPKGSKITTTANTTITNQPSTPSLVRLRSVSDSLNRERQTETERERQRERQRGTETDRQTDRDRQKKLKV